MAAVGEMQPPANGFALSQRDYQRIERLFARLAGIHLSEKKKGLITGRLAKRLRHYGLRSFRQYIDLLEQPEYRDELRHLVDLLTTHETYFFREPQHFDVLAEQALPERLGRRRSLRAWSAASSTGEEVYSIAMVLAQRLGEDGAWEVVGSDISELSLATAAAGRYPLADTRNIPPTLLERFCLRGVRSREGSFIVRRALRRRCRFVRLSLVETLPDLGCFDLIFLRNVLIYFDPETKREVIRRVAERLEPGGWLFVGHAESIQSHTDGLRMVVPSVYVRD